MSDRTRQELRQMKRDRLAAAARRKTNNRRRYKRQFDRHRSQEQST
jgi:hypothetical protein